MNYDLQRYIPQRNTARIALVTTIAIGTLYDASTAVFRTPQPTRVETSVLEDTVRADSLYRR